jgi:hypothetical protein
MMNIFHILMGLVVLLFGRKLFWVFVGYVGFIVGFYYANQMLALRPGLIVFLVALVAGIIGAVLAIFFQHIAIIVSGFLAGGYLTIHLLNVLRVNPGQLLWLLSIAGGIIGAVLLWGVFDYALIFLSSVVGAWTIVTSNLFRARMNSVVFFILFLIGVIVQALHFHKELRSSR